MNIFLCLNHFLPLQVAGTEIYCLQLAKHLQVNGHNITVLIPNYGKVENEEYVYEGIRVLQFAEPSVVDRALMMRKKIPLGVIAFGKILEQEKPDVLHFHSVGGSNGVGMHHVRKAASLSLKMLFTFHIAGYSCSTGTLRFKNQVACDGYIDPLRCTVCIYASKNISGLKERGLYTFSNIFYYLGYNSRNWRTSLGTALGFPFMIKDLKQDLLEMSCLGEGIIVLTHWYKKVLELNGLPARKLFYIPQGLPIAPPPKKENREQGIELPLRFIYIGRIIPDKGLHLLIEALQKLDPKKFLLTIYGSVANEGYYEILRGQTKGNGNINWNGILPPAQIMATISQYDCLCVPSIICEMSPLVIQEAFAVKVPVLASDVYGNAEQVSDQRNGWLFRQGDVIDLQKKIESLMLLPEMIVRAKKNIESVRTFENVGSDHEKLYQQLMKLSA